MSDAIQLLEEQHAEATALFLKLERLTDARILAETFRLLDSRLRDHTAIEEEIFYKAFRERARDRKQASEIDEALREHGEVKNLLADAERADPSSMDFKRAIFSLKQAVQHHVREEEQEILPQAARLFSTSELDDLGFRMMQFMSLHSSVYEMT